MLVDGVDVVRALPLVPQYGVTNVPGAPALWAAWAASSDAVDMLDGLRIAFSGSAALPPEVQHRVHTLTGWYVHEGYGLTEAAPGVSSTVVSGRAKPGSVGQPFPGIEVRLVDDDGDDIDPAEGDPGEIWIKGDNLFSGYWPDGAGGPDADGWYATGDVAFADEDGDLHIVDRRKDVVIVSGFNVYPHEVETVLLQHPGVRDAAVIGVPDDRTGEAVKAFVVLGDRSRHDRRAAGARRRAPGPVQAAEGDRGRRRPAALADRQGGPRATPARACGRGRVMTDAAAVRITLLGKPGCHLCDDARVVIERVASDVGVGWVEVDITGDPELQAKWWDQIPVTLVDGVQHDFWRVDEATASEGPVPLAPACRVSPAMAGWESGAVLFLRRS